ncbi:uncharacterized protein LOC124628187 [Tachysurus ichikawai]
MDEVPIVVHMYNPRVVDEDIRAFLSRHCTSVSTGEKLRGRFGIWNGKRSFLVRLKMDPAAPGHLLHPPGSFLLGPHQGFLHYPGQSQYCRRCGALGHVKEDCTGQRWGAVDHIAADCGAPKTCSLCGSKEHLFRHCPSYKSAFSSLFIDDLRAMGAPHPSGQDLRQVGPKQRKNSLRPKWAFMESSEDSEEVGSEQDSEMDNESNPFRGAR